MFVGSPGSNTIEQSGTTLNHLQLEADAVQSILEACASSGEGRTTIRLNPGSAGSGASESTCDVGYVCNKCHLAFANENALTVHQNNLCKTQGAVRLVRTRYHCSQCDSNETFDSVQEYQRHYDAQHQPDRALSPSSGLSHEMEDVVNQITALAAKAAQQNSPSDSNANIFCPPPEPKKSKLFLTPNSVAVPSTGQ